MARRSEHSKEEIKAMVLQAAETIVIEEGFAALNVRKIAMEIDYAVGSIYMVFANMDDLVMHINAQTLDKLSAQLEQVANTKLEPKQTIVQLASTYLNFAISKYNLWSMIFEYRLSGNQQLPDWYQVKIDSISTQVEKVFKEISPHKTDTDIITATRALWSGVHGICILSLDDNLDTDAIEDTQTKVILLVKNFILGWITK
jgi:AcrR family transcriptional regulator